MTKRNFQAAEYAAERNQNPRAAEKIQTTLTHEEFAVLDSLGHECARVKFDPTGVWQSRAAAINGILARAKKLRAETPQPDAGSGEIEINGLRLVCTCSACPEQYDVFDGDTQVGYLRLRHGSFRADVPDCGGKTVYAAHTQGDGVFEDDERLHYLTEAVAAIQKARLKT